MNPIKPDHYKGNRFEAIDIIEDYELNFNLGNVVKYILRHDKKGDVIENLKKAEFYIKREIDRLINERLESTDAVRVQEFHKSADRIARMITDADERELW